MDEYEGMRKFGREVDKIAGKMREMRASSEVEKMKCGPDGRQSASRERGMTGIERLRGVAGFWRENRLDDIVEQIEREQGGRVSRMRVLSVVTEMERHVSGAEGMGDSPVARWARELREAFGGDGRDHAADVSMSAYDLLPADEREAIAWVRDHGGLDAVDAIWDNDVPLAEAVISELWPDGRPDECGNDDVMGELRRRLMPEGCEWPRYESGELVEVGDGVSVTVHDEDGDFERTMAAKPVSFSGHGVIISDPCHVVRLLSGERVKRPAVLAVDGEPLEVGQTVWDKDAEADTPLTVVEVSSDLVRCEYTWKDGKTYRPCYPPDQLTHQRPVLDADGVPIHEGDHGWWVEQPGVEIVVKHIDPDECDQLTVCDVHGRGNTIGADEFTHTKPEPPDSWERVEEDAGCTATKYNERRGTIFTTKQQVARDLVRRCRALAERERGE